MPTGKEYAKLATDVYKMKPQAGYIWGTGGVTWTKARQDNLVAKYNSNPTKYSDYKLGALYGSKWIGHVVYDCSGLTSSLAKKLGLSFHHGSNSSYLYDCSYKGEKTADMKLPVGAWVYTYNKTRKNHGHIGIVVDDEYVVEAEGTKAGVVRSKISAKKWTYWGLAKGMEFDFIPGQSKEEQGKTGTDKTGTGDSPVNKPTKIYYPTLRRGSKGDLVTQLQRFLAQDGSSLAVDGIFGPGTQSAVRAFQKRYGLTVDGIVGSQTWGKLLELYS